MKMCKFCKEYKYETIRADDMKVFALFEIGVKMCTYMYKTGKKDGTPSSLFGRFFKLNYCPVCGKKLNDEDKSK